MTAVAAEKRVPEGGVVMFTLTADPPPTSPLTVNVSWIRGITRLSSTLPLPKTVTIPVSGSQTLAFATVDDLIDNYFNDGWVAIQLQAGNRYFVGQPYSATVFVVDDEFTPIVKISTPSTSVNEGDTISLTLTAEPPEERFTLEAVDVNLTWSTWTWSGPVGGNRRLEDVDKVKLNNGQPLPQTVTIPASGTKTITVTTRDDSVYTHDYNVRVAIAEGDYIGVGGDETITVNEDESLPSPKGAP